MTNAQRDQAYKCWSNLSAVKNFGDAIQSLAKFGQPKTAVSMGIRELSRC